MSLAGNGEPLKVFEDRKFKYEFGDKGIQLERPSGQMEMIKILLHLCLNFCLYQRLANFFIKGQI